MGTPLSFHEWRTMSLLTESDPKKVITHLTHLEDLVLTKFYPGAREATTFVDGLAEYFSGQSDASVNVNVKIDGAPSLIAGKDPKDDQFFIGTKIALGANPEVAKSLADIEQLYAGKDDLIDTLKVAFQTLQPLAWPRILQGDVLFTPALKQKQTIAGVPHVIFQPNTIVYGVPLDTKLGRQIDRAKFGIAFHTTYVGSTLDNLTAIPEADLDVFQPSEDVVILSNDYQDMSGHLTFTKSEMAELDELLKKLHRMTPKLRGNVFVHMLKELPLLRSEFMVFQNALVRQGKSITLSPKTFGKQFVLFLAGRQRDISRQKRTTKGMGSVSDRYKAMAKAIADHYDDVVEVLGWQRIMITIKEFLLKKLNTPSKLETFYSTKKGLIAGPHEGFVASDKHGHFVKLVDRSYFSRINLLRGRFAKTV